ncbi:MAG TPA: 4-hydroxy-3-methylbut-2-enyl diphosphate reductase [Fibrobacteria bacterium]|nr:4-hydroxy-3-methylbut-2-enyl diphosphate reductase [Fibrobacteria bacterium]
MKIYLASPRGFCAGVQRAISIVEKAIERFGAPVYVRHEIVHNQHVVSRLREKGAVFVEELEEVPAESVAIFSAHGVPTAVYKEAETRKLVTVDATCPLVKRVHSAVKRHNLNELQVVLIGHRGHPEVVGTMGQLENGNMVLVEKPEDVWALEGVNEEGLAYTTQTTLSIEETKDIIAALKQRFPKIRGPEKGDLCYATTNRQSAVTRMAGLVDMLLVIGSKNSSNSNRLRELGERMGKPSYLIDGPADVRHAWFEGVTNVGISSGASAPEDLVQDVVKWIQSEFPGTEAEDYVILEENVHFSLPDILAEAL